MWVFDATPLIYLAKVERLGLVDHLDGSCVTPARVRAEVVDAGLDEGYPDARRIERCLEAGTIDVVTVEETPLVARLQQNTNCSDADVAVLAHAAETDGVAVMDEAYGRDVADIEDIQTRGTAYIVLSLVADGVLPSTDARATIDAMLDAGWYCAPDTYAHICRKLEELAE
jgi:predicted nucleic acid-binding protein